MYLDVDVDVFPSSPKDVCCASTISICILLIWLPWVSEGVLKFWKLDLGSQWHFRLGLILGLNHPSLYFNLPEKWFVQIWIEATVANARYLLMYPPLPNLTKIANLNGITKETITLNTLYDLIWQKLLLKMQMQGQFRSGQGQVRSG